MQIDSMDVFHVALPFRQPQRTPAGAFDALETVLVRMRSGEVVGWGEASPGNAPLSGPDWAAGAFRCIKDWLAPRVAGTMVETADALAERTKAFRGNRFAKAAIDMAWWDLRARREQKPLAALLGAKREAVEVGPTFDQMDSIDDFLARIARTFEAGFARVKLMIRPGWDIQMIDFTRKEFPTEMLFGDCEAALGLHHTDILYRFEDFALDLLEQPLPADDLVGHAMIQESMKTPICLDEGVTTVEQADVALELKSCRCMNVEPGRVGGLLPAVAIHDLCRDMGVSCYVGARPQSAVATRFGLALAAKENFTLPADLFAAEEVLAEDVAPPLQPARIGDTQKIPLWLEPGIGIEPSAEVIERHCRERASIG
jgi:O-succinylbenzoate synthase